MMKVHYNPRLKQLASDLRKKGNLAEVLLWDQLKGKKIKGYQFMRQKPIENFVVDFYCSRLKLVIEIDGSSHGEKSAADSVRQRKLESLELSVLRFHDMDVKRNLSGVVQTLTAWVEEREMELRRQPP